MECEVASSVEDWAGLPGGVLEIIGSSLCSGGQSPQFLKAANLVCRGWTGAITGGKWPL